MKIPLLNTGDVFLSKGFYFIRVNNQWYASSTKLKGSRSKLSEFVVVDTANVSVVEDVGEKQKLITTGYKVVCRPLKDGKWDPDGVDIIFFQTKHKYSVLKKIKVRRTMRKLIKFV